MFGFGAPELVILTIIALSAGVVVRVLKTPQPNRTPDATMTTTTQSFKLAKSRRACLQCGYRGAMTTWFNHLLPLLAAIALLFAYIVPGLIFIAWGWGKYKCPNCNALGKNRPLNYDDIDNDRACPFCAEKIKREAIACKHCGRDLPQSSPAVS